MFFYIVVINDGDELAADSDSLVLLVLDEKLGPPPDRLLIKSQIIINKDAGHGAICNPIGSSKIQIVCMALHFSIGGNSKDKTLRSLGLTDFD